MYGFRVSKTGKDCTSTNISDLAYDSRFNTFKMAITKQLSISLPNEIVTTSTPVTKTVTYAHGLSYIPFILPLPLSSWVNGNSNYEETVYDLPYSVFTMSLNKIQEAMLSIDATNITYSVKRSTVIFDDMFSATTAICNVTIFYNKVNEVINYLE